MLFRSPLARQGTAVRSRVSWRKFGTALFLVAVTFLSVSVHRVSAQAAPATNTSTGAGAAFEYLGVNMHSLGVHDDGTIDSVLGYLEKCGVNTVRTFGPSERGGAARIKQVAAIAGRHNIKLIVALADFANGSAQMSGATGDPAGYFGGGYRTQGYRNYVQEIAGALNGDPNIAVVELANEPHCVGRAECLDPYVSWVGDAAGILAGKSFGVSIGSAIFRGGYGDEPGVGFERSNSQPGITQGSGHFYPSIEEEKRSLLVQAATWAQGAGKEMMMGEFGIPCNSSPCTQSSNDEERAEDILKEMSFFGQKGYDGFLYWQFSGFKSNPLENDQYSWFADGPEDTDNPICQALREGSFTLKEKPKPTLMYPKDIGEAEKYLANSQVYCAPQLVLRPEFKGTKPPLGPNPKCTPADELGNGLPADQRFNGGPECDPYEYEITENVFEFNLGSTESASISFPLFRDENGGISIEADLSRLDPNQTWLQAFKNNSRPDVAPALYLSSPVTQCQNVTRFIKYVQKVCSQYDPETPIDKCGINTEVTMADGSSKHITELAGLFPEEGSCNTIAKDIETDTPKAQALRSVSPATPRLYKMAFIAQHTYLHDDNWFASKFYMLQQISSWFTRTSPVEVPFYGEMLDVVPVWYNAGIAMDAFDQFADPVNGQIRPYAFDPSVLTGHDKAKDMIKNGNYLGPWTKTYESLLPVHFQEKIAEERMRTVWENAQMIRQAKAGQWVSTFVSYDVGGEKIEGSAPIDCTAVKGSAPGMGCLCFREDSPYCPNQSFETIIKAFPEDFETGDPKGFAQQLKLLVISRIKSGWQKSKPFNPAEPTKLTERVIAKCPYSPVETGVQEEVRSLGSSAMQNPTNIMDKMEIFFKSKLVPDSRIVEQDEVKQQRVQTFLILPDEALTIEKAQAYITPMFLSPEMYRNIMTGESDMFPLQEEAQRDQRLPFFSSFLRTFGFDPTYDTEEQGYILVEPTNKTYTVVPGADGGCELVSPVESRGEREWISKDDFEDMADRETEATCEYPVETRYTKIEDSTVEVKTKNEDKNPNPNPETPGQFAAMHEFLRRLAFTPHYMIPYQTYPGLETFYGGGGQSRAAPTSVQDTDVDFQGLSQYFQELLRNISYSYTPGQPDNSCGALYVDQATARRYGENLSALFQNQAFRDAMSRGQNKHLYTECGGMNCVDFIVQITTTTAVCDGRTYVNPYMAFAVATNETLGLTGDVGFHYGCNVPAFTDYNQTATVDGMSCAVMNGAGNPVINPGIVARYGQVSQEVANTCIAAGASRDTAANRANTSEDGLACFMSVMQYQCRSGRNDWETLERYGYTDTRPSDIISRVDEAATIATRTDPSLRPLADALRADAAEMRRNMARCSH